MGIESFFGCFLIRAVGFEARAVLPMLSAVTLFSVGPVEGVVSGVFG
jgi:hypothetical protein